MLGIKDFFGLVGTDVWGNLSELAIFNAQVETLNIRTMRAHNLNVLDNFI